MFIKHGFRAFVVLLGLTMGASTMFAVVDSPLKLAATAAPLTAALTCNTATGTGTPTVITIKGAAGATYPISAITAAATNGVLVTPSGNSLASSSSTLTFTINAAPGCAGSTANAPGSTTVATNPTVVTFSVGANTDVTTTGSVAVTNTTSALTTSPSSLALICSYSSPNWTPVGSQTLSITSAATGGTPFTIDTVTNPLNASVTISSTTGATAGAVPATYSLAGTGPASTTACGGYAVGTTHTTTLHLLNAPAPDKTVSVTLQVLPATVLVAPTSVTLTPYIKSSGNPGVADVVVTSSPSGLYYFIDTTTLPSWLTVDKAGNNTPNGVRFSSTSICDNLAPGTYTAMVNLDLTGYAPLTVPISLTINNKAPKLTIEGGINGGSTISVNWTLGSPSPAVTVTALSSDSPIPYTLTTGGVLAPIVSTAQKTGLIYNFGTNINVTFNPTVFASAAPGNTLNGTLNFSYGTPAQQLVVTIAVNILSPNAQITNLSPSTVPTATTGQFVVAATGTGFVVSTDPLYRTKVGVVAPNTTTIQTDPNISTNVFNGSNMQITLNVLSTDSLINWASGPSIILGACNPAGVGCSTAAPGSTFVLNIGTNPIIAGITSSSSFTQSSTPTIAPYDIISIFGANFCPICGVANGGSVTTNWPTFPVLYGNPDTTYYTYPAALSGDAVSGTQRNLYVTFLTHNTTTVLGTAPLLFATNGQINAMVPGSLASGTVDVVVNFGYGSTTNLKSSLPFPITIAATDPGLFTVASDGRGDAAVIGANSAVVNSGNPAGIRLGTGFGDTVAIYMTGLGVPDSTADNATVGTGGGAVWSTDCITPLSYATSLANPSATTTIDGAVILSSLLNTHRLPPCAVNSMSFPEVGVTFGGVPGTVTYAGFVPDSIAGLYQVNVTLPDNLQTTPMFTTSTGSLISTVTTPVQLPVVVSTYMTGTTTLTGASQPGVTMWVAPRLKVIAPSVTSGTVDAPWTTGSTTSVTVTSATGTSPFTFALSGASGPLPSGLTLNTDGTITGTPLANTGGSYPVTVIATDVNALTGSVSFSVQVSAALYMITSPSPTLSHVITSGTNSGNRVIASGGTYPYTYAVSSPVTPYAGISISTSTGTITTTPSALAGIYPFTVTAHDANAGTQLTGTLTFNLNINLTFSEALTAPVSHLATAPVTTSVTLTGNNGTVVYSLAAAQGSTLPVGLAINSGTGVVTATTVAAGTYPVVITATDGSTAAGSSGPAIATVALSITIT